MIAERSVKEIGSLANRLGEPRCIITSQSFLGVGSVSDLMGKTDPSPETCLGLNEAAESTQAFASWPLLSEDPSLIFQISGYSTCAFESERTTGFIDVTSGLDLGGSAWPMPIGIKATVASSLSFRPSRWSTTRSSKPNSRRVTRPSDMVV